MIEIDSKTADTELEELRQRVESLEGSLSRRDKEVRKLTAKVVKLRGRLRPGAWKFWELGGGWKAILDGLRADHWMQFGEYRQYSPRAVQTERFPRRGRGVSDEELPMISVVTPSFNHRRYLGATIESVLGQGYPKLEYTVQDGASGDGTVELLEKIAAEAGEGFSWRSEADSGQAQAINRGMERSRGDVLAWLNSDDLLMQGTLRHVGSLFARNPQLDVVYGYRVCIDEAGREVGRWMFPDIHQQRTLKVLDLVPQETMFWRRRAWEEVGGELDESLQFAIDWDLLLKFSSARVRFLRTPYFLGLFRVHPSQKSCAMIGDVGMREMTMLRERYGGGRTDWRAFDREFARATRGGFVRAELRERLGIRI